MLVIVISFSADAPNHSQRSKRPSAEASEALVSSPPQRVGRGSEAVNGNVL